MKQFGALFSPASETRSERPANTPSADHRRRRRPAPKATRAVKRAGLDHSPDMRYEPCSTMSEAPGATSKKREPLVGIIMGSDSDLPTLQKAVDVFAELGIAHEVR